MAKFGLNRLFRALKRSQNGVYKRVFNGNNKESIVLTPSSIKYQIILLVFLTFSMLYAIFFVPFEGSDSPSCRGIYMYPSYAKLNDMDSFQQTRFAKKYHLYLYREQKVDPTPISSTNEILLDGVPVLFIPGNAGSFKQGRSIAAQAANYYFSDNDQSLLSLEDYNKKNLDFFTLDFNEDFTAFHGQTMLDQAEFVNDCIKFILSLYQTSKGTKAEKYGPLPTSVIIVGHSMGGIVSRVLPLLDNYVPESINTILTLSSPHSLSPLSFDGDLLKVYKKIDEFWVKEFDDPSSFIYNNVSIISITGGILDDVLPSDYTLVESVLNDVAPLNNGLTVYTSGIPKVWTSIDHLAVVWCDQLRKVVAKLLLEIVDKNSACKTISLQKRMSLFQFSLLDNNIFENELISNDGRTSVSNDATSVKFLKFIGDSIEVDSFNDKGKYMISLDQLKSSTFWDLEICSSIETFDNIDVSLCDSYFKCQKISYLFKDIPNSKFNTLEESTSGDEKSDKSLTIMNETLNQYEYLKINIKEQVNSKLSISKFKTDNYINVKFIDLVLFGVKLPVNRNANMQLFNIKTFISSNIAFKLEIDSDFMSGENHPLIKQHISQPYETKWHIVKPETESLSITTAVNPPFIPTTTNYHLIELKLYNDDHKVHSLKLKIDFIHTLKLIIKRYRLSFATFPVGLTCIMFLFQLRSFAETGEIISMTKCLKYCCSFITVWGLVLCSFIELLLQFNVVRKVFNLVDCVMVNDNLFNKAYSKFQKNEFLGNSGLSLDNILIDYLVLMLSLVLVMLTGGLILVVEKLANKCKKKIDYRGDQEEDMEKTKKLGLQQILTLGRLLKFGVLIFAVFFYVPYQLIFVLLTISHLLYVVILFFSSIKSNRNVVEFNKAILLMMLLILPVCIPIVVVFLHNLAVNWKTPFRSHHNILAIFPIISLVFCLQNDMMLKQEKNFNFRVTCFLLSYMCFFSFVFGVRNTYFIYHLFNLLACTLCMGMF